MVGNYRILITGANGQLGQNFIDLKPLFPNYLFFYASKKDLDISKKDILNKTIDKYNINLLINCASFTDVDAAEKNIKTANSVNNSSLKMISEICKNKNIKLIHISTDYVFDGKKNIPYSEPDITNPLNNYGLTKRNGEIQIINSGIKNSLIIRTSWLYSKYGSNFLTKILSLTKSNNTIKVTKDEIGSPTCALDLAKHILQIIPNINNDKVELFHYSNKGMCSRYEFAKKFLKTINIKTDIIPIKSTKSNVKRPNFSCLNSGKIESAFNIKIEDWEYSLLNYVKFFSNEFKM